MSKLNIHDEASAPAAARPVLESVRADHGMIPNMLAVLAENPAALEACLSLSRFFDTAGFTPLERQVVLLTVSIENTCHFCVAAHSAASAAAGLDMTVIEAVRNNQPLADPRLEGLRLFTRRIVRQRGFVSDADVTVFLRAGWDKSAILGVILGVALKTISNYTNHVAETPLNPAYRPFAWAPCTRACGGGSC
ncbi:carboxymuconolactone decarboxylase family protein [Hyphomonas sp.]|uniref:carboxymuconolactone decarboxylase family protein n=1 Tax=Hyphomonas sp. TaxID=87 RepID=UPI0032EB389E|tara:strand:+ start:1419 stop:1997 length:579 start_codon:yes stop_codon:yes gene_type:complete